MGAIMLTLKAAVSNPPSTVLTLGQDVTQLLTNLNSPDNIIPTFGGPFTNYPLGTHNFICNTPPEYQISNILK